MKMLFIKSLKKTGHPGYLIPVCVLIVVASLLLGSCKKFIEIPPPATELVSSNVFKSDPVAESVVNGMYSYMYNYTNAYSGNMTILPAMTSDELYYFQSSSWDAFKNNALQANIVQVDSLWSDSYSIIYQANAIIQGMQNSSGVSAANKKQFTGEAKFMRAFCNFYLVNLFGDVPLVTTTDVNGNRNTPRTPKADIYKAVISDLTDAQNLLAADYSNSNNERTRANRWAAAALLARVYLYNSNWQGAEQQATAVINNSLYSIIPDPNQVFIKNNSEAILQLNTTGSVTDNYTSEGAHFIPGGTVPNYVLQPFLLNAFEPGDLRKADWTATINFNGNAYYYPYKYKDANTGLVSNGGEYYTLLRLGEQYLIRAEALAEQDKLTEAAADLNVIRHRAGLPNTTASDKSSLLSAIAHERQTELFCEWGHRWFDLNRTNQSNTVLGGEKPGLWKSTAVLFPIPQNEIQNNPMLTQNPGY